MRLLATSLPGLLLILKARAAPSAFVGAARAFAVEHSKIKK
jgi:hypothetical protein